MAVKIEEVELKNIQKNNVSNELVSYARRYYNKEQFKFVFILVSFVFVLVHLFKLDFHINNSEVFWIIAMNLTICSGFLLIDFIEQRRLYKVVRDTFE